MTRTVSYPLVAIALAVASASPVAAQPVEEPESPRARESVSFLDVTVDLFGALDRSLGSVDRSLGPIDEPQVDSGDRTYWGGNSELTYNKESDRWTIGANLGASVRRLTNVTEGTLPSYSGSLMIDGPLTQRTSWQLTQSVSYGPTNAVSFFAPGDAIQGVQSVPLTDYRLTDQDQFTSSTRASVGWLVTRRGTVSLYGGYEHAGEPAALDPETSTGSFRRWSVGGRYTQRVSRYMSWYGGYGLTENAFSGDSSDLVAVPRMHTIDSGVAYERPLSFSRRTHVSMSMGSSIIPDPDSNERTFRLNGTASLRHQIGKTWMAQLGYFRDTNYVPTFADPVTSDAVTVSIDGSLSEKASVGLLTNYAQGKVGVTDLGENGYTVASASAEFRYALFTPVAIYLGYFLFDADFDRDVTLGDQPIRASQRHGLRFGVSIGTGLWGNRRRAPGRPVGQRTGERTR